VHEEGAGGSPEDLAEAAAAGRGAKAKGRPSAAGAAARARAAGRSNNRAGLFADDGSDDEGRAGKRAKKVRVFRAGRVLASHQQYRLSVSPLSIASRYRLSAPVYIVPV
jgi:hypothetical protein